MGKLNYLDRKNAGKYFIIFLGASITFSVLYSFLDLYAFFIAFLGISTLFLHHYYEKSEFLWDYRLAILVSLIVLGGYLRFNGLASRSMWFDETVSANIAYSFWENGVPEHSSGRVEWRAFPHIFLVSVFGGLLGFSDFTIRSVSVIASLLTILVTFKLGNDLYGGKTGIIAAFIVSVLAFQIKWAQMGRMYALFQLFYILCFFYLYRLSGSFSKSRMFFLMISILLAMLTHLTGYIIPFLVVAYILYENRNKVRDQSFLSIMVLTGLISLLASFLYVDYRELFYMFVLYDSGYMVYLYWLWDEMKLLVLLSFLGGLYSLRNSVDQFVLVSLALFPATYIYLFHYPRVAARHLYFTIPFLAIWSGLALDRLASLFEGKWRKISYLLIFTILSTGFLVPSLTGQDAGMMGSMPDYESSFSYVEENYEDEDVLITDLPPISSYYFKDPDFTAVNSITGKDLLEDGREHYSGSEPLESPEELNEVINQTENGWLVLDSTFYDGWSSEIMKESDETEYRSYRVKVWRW